MPPITNEEIKQMATSATAPATDPAEIKDKPATKRGYVVLRKNGPEWKVLHDTDKRPIEATTDLQAIREALDRSDADDRTGTCVAVPLRSWNPRTRAVKTVQKDIWS